MLNVLCCSDFYQVVTNNYLALNSCILCEIYLILQKWGCRNTASLCSDGLRCRISECLGFSCILCENCLILQKWRCRNSASLCSSGLRFRIFSAYDIVEIS